MRRNQMSARKQAVKRIRIAIRERKKIARQINRKLASLEKWKAVVDFEKENLKKLCQKSEVSL